MGWLVGGGGGGAYLIFVIFVTQARFLEPKFYTEKFVNQEKSDFATNLRKSWFIGKE